MNLFSIASQYVLYKQGMGMRFHTEARTLSAFCHSMGDIRMAEIAAERVHAYIAGSGPVTRYWHRKYEVLRGFSVCHSARLREQFPSPQGGSKTTGICSAYLLA
jgi:integrase/recombinase XerD